MKAVVAEELCGPSGLVYPGAEQLFGFGVSQLVAAGLTPPPPVRYPLALAAEALDRLTAGGVFGKLALEP